MLVVLSDKMIDLVNKIFDAAEGAAENGRPLWQGILKPPQTQKIRHSRTRRRKGEQQKTQLSTYRRATPRPYLQEAGGATPPAYSPPQNFTAGTTYTPCFAARCSFSASRPISRSNHEDASDREAS